MNREQLSEQYSEQEAQQRFLGTLKAALNTPPKPLKMVPLKRVPAPSKKKRSAK